MVMIINVFLKTVISVIAGFLLQSPQSVAGQDGLVDNGVLDDIITDFRSFDEFSMGNNSTDDFYLKAMLKSRVETASYPSTSKPANLLLVNPRGMFLSTMIVLSFHNQFVSKQDRVYMIQCYYMEAEKMMQTEIQVAMLTTSFQTATVPMPVCRYEVLSGGPSGPPIRFAQIGEKVYHKWICDSDTVDTFCMVVHSCNVQDGNGQDIVNLIDNNGCTRDRHLLDNLEYPTDLMAGKETHVFKYADRSRLFFDCQIAISVKEPNTQCFVRSNFVFSRPACDEQQQQIISRRGKRSNTAAGSHQPAATAIDDMSKPKPIERSFIEYVETHLSDNNNNNMDRGSSSAHHLGMSIRASERRQDSAASVCMSWGSASAYAVYNIFMILMSAFLIFGSCKQGLSSSSNDDMKSASPNPYSSSSPPRPAYFSYYY